ncbi:LPS export ABC transporter periplasmic protein LptC [Phaeobacter sp. QD34_3]|uniref:LPS export ABC transporter periplasmic protein LptC n=1 Tax=unclassified Phaeobacter TaxID=2621772 RepID=UPI00237F3B63|nr:MULTISPECIES: LPS export ABC transporter periplasmic protein LptC [unclassified Phaeobacter]MDE4134329.1 LPS export ABC transporter periplasmic protein LptC [Phaeobacter sp. QD34_3]MDE4137662.1 LPS export ABC transporter periplasmic protein LptC [Phaeobacter sp. QD34_24]MDE4172915.1 LPS export ABC transporter periplasmic protein LptC [Phaeobacter sp. PT47_59]
MDRYSRMVAYLKVLLPLTALALLSTLFLISRGIDTDAVIPFAQKEIEERMRGQQITGPFFSGTTADGDEIMVTASVARPGSSSGNGAMASDLEAVIRMAQGGRMTLVAETGTIHPGQDMARFTGNVRLTSVDELVVETEELETSLSSLRVQSPGAVRATGPMGTLTAGQMLITAQSEGAPVQMLFKNRVKLVYDPSSEER